MTASLPSTTATIRAAHLSANSSAWPAVAGRSRNASQPAKDTSDCTTIRCGSTTPGTGTSHWPCSGTPSSPFSPDSRPPPSGEKRGPAAANPTERTDASDGPTTPGTPGRNSPPAPPRRRRIRLTLAEVRRLFDVRHQAKDLIHTAMDWSIYRRQHQAEARRHHVKRRLALQV